MNQDDQVTPADNVAGWIASRAKPIKAIEAGNGFEDLQFLKEHLADVRLVGLGESTHGTREFFQLKHRLTEFLVQEMGFSAFLLEASYAACFNIDAYVTRREGDPAAALASQGFWTWDTEEVSDLIEWMASYNDGRPEVERVRFLGYDVQRVNEAITHLRAYLRSAAPDIARLVEPVFNHLWEDDIARPSELEVLDDLTRSQFMGQLYALTGYLGTHRVRLQREYGAEETFAVIEYAKNVFRYFDSYGLGWGDGTTSFEKRDCYMAHTIEEILETLGPDAKAVVWAHNGHITTHSYLPGITSMGGHLREAFGDAYYAVGFSFNEGAFQSRRFDSESDVHDSAPLEEFSVGPAPEGYLESYFAQCNLEPSFVNLRGEAAAWIEQALPSRSIGAGYSTNPDLVGNFCMNNPPSEYDGLIYIPTTTRARPNPTGLR